MCVEPLWASVDTRGCHGLLRPKCAENNPFTGHIYFYPSVTLVSPPACGRALGIRSCKHISRCEPSLHPGSGVSFGRTPAQPDALEQQRVPTHPAPCIFHKWRRAPAHRSRRAQCGGTSRTQSAAHLRCWCAMATPQGALGLEIHIVFRAG